MQKTIRDLTDNFVSIARKNNLQTSTAYDNTHGVDINIFKLLPNAIVSPNPFPKGDWKQVDSKNGTTEKEMLKTAQKMSLSQGIQCFTEELINGTLNKLEFYMVIFIEEKNQEGASLRLFCWRFSGGSLHLNLCEVDNGYAWTSVYSAWRVATNV